MSIFQKILGSASMTAITYLAEDALPHATSDSERQALQAIMEAARLDETYAIAHDQLGNTEEAAHLRSWMASHPSTSRQRLAAL